MENAAKQVVLVVDDEPQVLLALEDLLSDKFTVLTTGSAENALEVMNRERDIAVVITDQRMPNMKGLRREYGTATLDFDRRSGSSNDTKPRD